jgi:hypothetical protein
MAGMVLLLVQQAVAVPVPPAVLARAVMDYNLAFLEPQHTMPVEEAEVPMQLHIVSEAVLLIMEPVDQIGQLQAPKASLFYDIYIFQKVKQNLLHRVHILGLLQKELILFQ